MYQQLPSGRFPKINNADNGSDLAFNHTLEDQIHQRLIREIDQSVMRGLGTENFREDMERATRTLVAEYFPHLVGDSKESAIAHVVDEVTGLGPLEPLIRDPSVSEIMVNGPQEIFFERNGIIHRSPIAFRDTAHISRIIDHIVSSIGRHVDEASPMVDARWRDGSRVNIIIPPLTPKSPIITIRKFLGDHYTMADLIKTGTLTDGMARVLEGCVKAKLNMVISGGTGSGKTTFLNSLSAFMPDSERIVTVEDPIELKLQQQHVVQLEARPASSEGKGEVSQRDLVRNALRMRPDRIIVGEVRGSEAFDMMQAMNTGHDGSLTTVHANTPRDALGRISNMILMAGFDLPARMIHEQVTSALQVIIQLTRLLDGSRRVVQITEISGMEGEHVALQDIFVHQQTGIDAEGKVLGQLKATGIRPKFADRLRSFGVDLPKDIFDVARWG
ncbi:MAG TPA: CpaF family protein [Dehalococcoidia bacterium]|nr:CpaF family protein [Dehalococcoidia bacterium]